MNNRPKTLYLIDGYASIFRAYYAIRRPLYSPTTGEQTQAVLIFAQMLLKLFATQPDYVVFAMDAPGETFREAIHAEYVAAMGRPAPVVGPETLKTGETPKLLPVESGYKGTRMATPDGLIEQVGRILELVSLFGIPIIGKTGLEADDIIATITDRVLADPAQADLRVRIVSKDKDLEQLLNERVTLYDIHTEAEMDVAALKEKRGIEPGQVVDLLMLTGDTVDNVPGVNGIGPKTAAKLLQQYGSVDGILENLTQIKGSWRENLENARPLLPFSRRLLSLKRDPEIPFSLEEAQVRPLPSTAIASLFDELGFHRIKDLLPPENADAVEGTATDSTPEAENSAVPTASVDTAEEKQAIL
jgi:DNA polymerase I